MEEITQQDQGKELERETAHQIFANAPTMLALCLTVIGLIKIYASLQRITTLIDNCLAGGVIAFLIATVCSYLSIRAVRVSKRLRYEQWADVSFLAGLSCATVVAVMITFELAG